jgi:hypothetical protein
MKIIYIENFGSIDQRRHHEQMYGVARIEGGDNMQVSDGSHTFDELYDHRITLFIALCRSFVGLTPLKFQVWRSKLHSDGSEFDGWFVLGIGKEKGKQITYHLPNIRWDEVSFVETLDKAPEWDGHTPQDVLLRLKDLI